eukprot:TRINITY_DN42033_c0_g1_i1.p1 TRINITY_DN42033_c0_g1~~TRINITY_DN42033_c0_g1_i1.p1  ORF type:complete len:767 (+),score=136.11 TRINITY_DN42033_c0_g1_i1:59-2359(+)
MAPSGIPASASAMESLVALAEGALASPYASPSAPLPSEESVHTMEFEDLTAVETWEGDLEASPMLTAPVPMTDSCVNNGFGGGALPVPKVRLLSARGSGSATQPSTVGSAAAPVPTTLVPSLPTSDNTASPKLGRHMSASGAPGTLAFSNADVGQKSVASLQGVPPASPQGTVTEESSQVFEKISTGHLLMDETLRAGRLPSPVPADWSPRAAQQLEPAQKVAEAARVLELEQRLAEVLETDKALEEELARTRRQNEQERNELKEQLAESERRGKLDRERLEQVSRLQAQLQAENEELFTELERAAQRIEALKDEVRALQKHGGSSRVSVGAAGSSSNGVSGAVSCRGSGNDASEPITLAAPRIKVKPRPSGSPLRGNALGGGRLLVSTMSGTAAPLPIVRTPTPPTSCSTISGTTAVATSTASTSMAASLAATPPPSAGVSYVPAAPTLQGAPVPAAIPVGGVCSARSTASAPAGAWFAGVMARSQSTDVMPLPAQAATPSGALTPQRTSRGAPTAPAPLVMAPMIDMSGGRAPSRVGSPSVNQTRVWPQSVSGGGARARLATPPPSASATARMTTPPRWATPPNQPSMLGTPTASPNAPYGRPGGGSIGGASGTCRTSSPSPPPRSLTPGLVVNSLAASAPMRGPLPGASPFLVSGRLQHHNSAVDVVPHGSEQTSGSRASSIGANPSGCGGESSSVRSFSPFAPANRGLCRGVGGSIGDGGYFQGPSPVRNARNSRGPVIAASVAAANSASYAFSAAASTAST